MNHQKERSNNETKFSDGEIFRNVRKYIGNKSSVKLKMWTARLSPCKLIALNQLLRHSQLVQALDALLPFPGLWDGLQLGNIQRLLALHCDEVYKSILVN